MAYIYNNSFVVAWIVWGLAAFFYCYEYLLRILPSVMTDDLRYLFGINGLALGNLSAIYYYAYIPMQLPAGILMDRFNPRKLLTLACLVCSLGTYWFAQPNLYLAYIGRFLVGAGSAFAFIGVMKLSILWFKSSYFSFLTGLTTSLGMLGAMIGNMTLTSLINLMGRNQMLRFGSMIGMILSLCIFFIIPDKPNRNMESTQSNVVPISSHILQIFSLFRDLQIWLLGLVGCCLFLSLTAFAEMWGIPYLTCCYGLSTHTAAHYNALVFLGWAIGGPLMGTIASRFTKEKDYLRLIIVNTLLGALVFSTILYFPHFSKPYLGVLLFLFGFFSAVQVLIFTIIRNFYTSNIVGSAFAVTNLFIMLGGGIAQPILGYLLDIFSHNHLSKVITFSPSAFTYTLSFIPAAFVLSTLLTSFIKKPVKQNAGLPS